MWNVRKPNATQGPASEPKNLATDKANTDGDRPVDSTVDRSLGWLGPTMHIKGDISGTEDLLIDGTIEGTIQLDKRKLTVGAAAKIIADINAREVVVHGDVKGSVRATGRIEIKKSGSVIGNLTTAQIMIEDGANFKGSIEIERETKKEPDKTSSHITAA